MFGQFAHFIGHHGKALALFAGAGGLIEALSASRLVWSAMSLITPTMRPISLVLLASCATSWAELSMVSIILPISPAASPSMRSLSLARFSARAAMSSTRRDDCARLVILLPSSSTALAIDAVDAPCSTAPAAICAQLADKSRAALETSPLAP